MKINTGPQYWDFDHEIVKYMGEPNAKYVADLAVRSAKGRWTGLPVAVFYTPTPRSEYHNHYFGLYKDSLTKKRMVCDADSVADHEWSGLEYNEEIVFSRWVHDFRAHPQINVFVDGGPDYSRRVGNFRACKEVKLIIRDGVFEVK